MRLSWKKMSGALALVGALVLALAMVAFSQGPQGGPPHGGPHGGPGRPGGDMREHLEMMARELGLTDEQRAQVQKIHESFMENTKSLHDQLRAQRDNHPDPLAGSFDEAAVRAAAEARAKIEVELEVAHARMMSQLINVLTPEQKARLKTLHQEMEQRHKEHRPPQPPPPPGDEQ